VLIYVCIVHGKRFCASSGLMLLTFFLEILPMLGIGESAGG